VKCLVRARTQDARPDSREPRMPGRLLTSC
jgi:hypothetical protein